MRTRAVAELQNGARLRTFVVETFEACSDLIDWLRRYVGLQPQVAASAGLRPLVGTHAT